MVVCPLAIRKELLAGHARVHADAYYIRGRKDARKPSLMVGMCSTTYFVRAIELGLRRAPSTFPLAGVVRPSV